MYSVTVYTLIESRFVSLNTNEDAGAIFFNGNPPNSIFLPLFSNVFLGCQSTGGRTSSGGAVETRQDSCPRFGNCLFSGCAATQGGGALLLFGTYPSPTVSFSFFHANTGTDELGHDCSFYTGVPSQPLLHCFTTRLNYGVYPSSYSNWLPQGSIYFVNSSSVGVL